MNTRNVDDVISDIINLLNRCKHDYALKWSEWFNDTLNELRSADSPHNRNKVYNKIGLAFGGMGSINDVYLYPKDEIQDDIIDINGRYLDLIHELHSIVHQELDGKK
jgi:hypothetical protein